MTTTTNESREAQISLFLDALRLFVRDIRRTGSVRLPIPGARRGSQRLCVSLEQAT